ncbi:hypothetical protein [Halobacterium sp. KA-6]|uniref:hypothetical protein n=1 Tax=Halobacterium sp. KA-6 TaxID=2896368 RepID=UPI001E552F0E|nr:hypothetical protein [Halobacterium sp. KA-6]MCD2203089.1 hypothetical protein [Halobacterium sp. KA-6]
MPARQQSPQHARVRRVTRVPVDEVPDGYPFDVDASHALELVVEREGESEDAPEIVRVFEAWPSGGHTGSRLARVLDAVGEPAGNPGALDGERVALESRDGAYRVDVERTQALRERTVPTSERTHSLAEVAIVAGALSGLLGFFLAWTTYRWAATPLVTLAIVVLALSLGYDAWRTHDTTWSPRPLPWAAGGVVPMLNVAVAAAYLSRKAVALNTPDDAAEVWCDLLAGTVVAFAVGLALAAFDLTFPVGATIFVHAWALAPVGVYLDARSDRHGSDQPKRTLWLAGAAVFGGAGALVYLLRTDSVDLQ